MAEVGEKVYMSSAYISWLFILYFENLHKYIFLLYYSLFYLLCELNKIALQMKNDVHKYLSLFATEYTQKLWSRPTHS